MRFRGNGVGSVSLYGSCEAWKRLGRLFRGSEGG